MKREKSGVLTCKIRHPISAQPSLSFSASGSGHAPHESPGTGTNATQNQRTPSAQSNTRTPSPPFPPSPPPRTPSRSHRTHGVGDRGARGHHHLLDLPRRGRGRGRGPFRRGGRGGAGGGRVAEKRRVHRGGVRRSGEAAAAGGGGGPPGHRARRRGLPRAPVGRAQQPRRRRAVHPRGCPLPPLPRPLQRLAIWPFIYMYSRSLCVAIGGFRVRSRRLNCDAMNFLSWNFVCQNRGLFV